MKSPRSSARLLAWVAILCISFSVIPSASAATPPQDKPAAQPTAEPASVTIPGPLRSFLRMAGISQKVSPEEVIPLLAHNVFALGYNNGQRSEFLILLTRYVRQARELATLAGPAAVIHVSTCEEAKPLLKVLGYRTRADCGQRKIGRAHV